jgi:tRNA-2-methylthio-N6-dimethylallyladenosine synthase
MINFYIKTYGCQANVADSQAISNLLNDLGCDEIKTEAGSDLIIINTCAIREKAEHKVYSYLGRLLKSRDNSPYLKIVVIGCIATYRKKEFYSRFPQIHFVAGARDNKSELRDRLIDIVLSLQTSKQVLSKKNDIKINLSKTNLTLGGLKKELHHSKQSFVNIMTGCSNFCTYCIVPFTRGKEISYLAFDIINKIKIDVENGAKEVIYLVRMLTLIKILKMV